MNVANANRPIKRTKFSSSSPKKSKKNGGRIFTDHVFLRRADFVFGKSSMMTEFSLTHNAVRVEQTKNRYEPDRTYSDTLEPDQIALSQNLGLNKQTQPRFNRPK